MSRVLVFPGSLRRESHNRRLADYLCDRLPATVDIDLLASDEVKLPLYDQDLESDANLIAKTQAAYERFALADGVIVVSPEFNGHVSSYLKNTVDWVSRIPRISEQQATPNPFRHKPLLLCSASTGWSGGLLGLQSARTLFGYLGCLVLPDQICLADVESLIFGETFALSPQFDDYILNTLQQFLEVVRKSQNNRHEQPAELISVRTLAPQGGREDAKRAVA
jgi:chromate reductase, NAD(P)H dehydrogenase (quinone)